jgi:hypothetical protein
MSVRTNGTLRRVVVAKPPGVASTTLRDGVQLGIVEPDETY